MEELDKGNWAIFSELLAPDFVLHTSGSPKPLTREENVESLRMFCAAFPDWSRTIEDMVAEGDRVVIRATGRGTPKGEFVGISATGKEVALTWIAILRIASGKIAEVWEEGDWTGLMRQLGGAARPKLLGQEWSSEQKEVWNTIEIGLGALGKGGPGGML